MATHTDLELGPLRTDVPKGSDDIIDAVAQIEMERQERAREVGNATACAAALRSLRALHADEKNALRTGPSDQHSANLAALAAEIGRVEKLSGGSARASLPEGDKREPRNRSSRPNGARSSARNNGRQNQRRNGSRQP